MNGRSTLSPDVASWVQRGPALGRLETAADGPQGRCEAKAGG